VTVRHRRRRRKAAHRYDEAQVMASEHPERPQAFLQKPYASADLKAAIAAALKER
jgi:hypothetical protein